MDWLSYLSGVLSVFAWRAGKPSYQWIKGRVCG